MTTPPLPPPAPPAEPPPASADLISVIIPGRNAAETIREQLDAVLAQSVAELFEVVVADNGSDDETPDIVRGRIEAREIGRADSLRLVDASGLQGSAHARNVGAAAARGRWLAFCDADDIVATGWLAALREQAQPDRIVGGALRTGEINDENARRSRPTRPTATLNTALGFLPFVPTGNMMIESDLFRRLGGLDERYLRSHDVEFSWRAQVAGVELAHAPLAIVDYRYRDTSASVFRQAKVSGRASAQLFAHYRAHGVPRRSVGVSLQDWGWLLVRLPYLAIPTRRRLWIRRAGEAVGRALGSVRFRVLYL